MNDSLANQLDSENTHVALQLFSKYSQDGEIKTEGLQRMITDVYGSTGVGAPCLSEDVL